MKKSYVELVNSVINSLNENGLSDDKCLFQKLINYAIDNADKENTEDEIYEMIKIRKNQGLYNEALSILKNHFGVVKTDKMIKAIQEMGVEKKPDTISITESNKQFIINLDLIHTRDISSLFKIMITKIIPEIIDNDVKSGIISVLDGVDLCEQYEAEKLLAKIFDVPVITSVQSSEANAVSQTNFKKIK